MDDNLDNYNGIKLVDNNGEEDQYLYKYSQDKNRRGTFITGLILKKTIENLKDSKISDDDFKEKQILWIQKQSFRKKRKFFLVKILRRK